MIMTMHVNICLAILTAAGAMLFSGCARQKPTRQTVEAEGVTGTVRVAAANVGELGVAAAGMKKALSDILPALDEKNPDSEIAKLNRLGGSARLPMSRQVFRALDLGRHYSGLTGGAYDYTAALLADIWKQGPPVQEVRDETLARTGMRFVEASDSGSIALTAPGVAITPGHLALAYAIDNGVVDLRRKMKGPFAVEFHGLARQEKIFPGEESPVFPVSLRQRGSVQEVGHVRLAKPGAVAIRVYPTWSTDPGLAQKILIDPRTGQPTSKTRLAVVLGPLTVKAYALAEALLVLGPEEGAAVLPEFSGYEAMVIPDRSPTACWMTPGFREHFVPADGFSASITNWVIPSADGLQGGEGGPALIEGLPDNGPDEVGLPEP